ncbi:uncharacterized protein LOC101460357 isoform X1 [Ceratitis capitata]|uniref:uncharacterized protein LOC101460357 isoform X1 n=1 Tax=Ceratitis capitata TaxID=7213 RepID=UPI00061895A4|nr:uncharacterized protein LOC101460357 isoform X1 [Ceratitis capitata]
MSMIDDVTFIGNDKDCTHISQSFRDQKQFELFIRRNQLIKIIEGATENFVKKYRESQKPELALGPLFVPLRLEYSEFIKNDAIELLHLAVEEPLQFFDAAKYCIYGLVRERIKLAASTEGCGALKVIDIDQIHLQVRFTGLPLQKDLNFAPFKNNWLPGLSWTTGIISAISEPQFAILQSIWYCSTGCNRNKINTDSINAPICYTCGRYMNEYAKLRITEKYHLLRILPAYSLENPRVTDKIFRSLTIHVREHVHDCELRLGKSYLITGYYDYTHTGQIFQAWSVMTH